MAKTLRVHNLAKELGVNSKDVLAKCEAEGIPGIKDHMSVVKIGLAVTIRQWFSDGAPAGGAEGADGADVATAVETAEKVDVKKVRKKAARKKTAKKKPAAKKAAAKKAEPAQAEPVEEAPAEVVPPEPAAVAEAPEPAVEAPAVEAPVAEASLATAEDTPAPSEVAPPEPAPVAAQAPAPVVPAGEQNVPDRPDVVTPAGEQLTEPKKVKLAGPKVVRVEKPEPAPAPRRRGPARSERSLAPGEVQGITRSRGPAGGGGVRAPMTPEGDGERRGPGGGGGGGGGGSRGGKRRSLSSRRGRSSDAVITGPTRFSQADLDELDARLKGATGFVKQRRRSMSQRDHAGPAQTAAEIGGQVEIEEPITIKALSSGTGLRAADIVKWLFKRGVMANVNSAIETEAAEEICLENDIELVVKAHETASDRIEKDFADRSFQDIRPRPPVVTVLGHVDHGKTSLLDKIRRADIAAHEDGGITQHIGAYRVSVQGGDGKDKTVVFLDTPGHAAFTSMRARGAKMTDLVVLVVAADDGVMPTTVESINHAKAAEVPIVVALNKIDLPGVNDDQVQKIYGQLAEHGLNPTDWGGETEVVRTSAETGQGITDLLELLDYQAELLELTAGYDGNARGAVIEAEMQPGRGSVARVLVQEGNIKVGDFIVLGRGYGRVRDMTNDRNLKIQAAGPATPLELSGIDEVPDAGDKFYVVDSLKQAEEVANQIREDERQQALASKTKVTLDNFAATIKAGQVQELRVVLKADVQGSVETLRQSLEQLGNDEVAVRVLHAAVGAITESDIDLADASQGIVLGFHVTANTAVREMAEQRKVDMRFYRVIYDLTDDVKKALEGMLTPETKEEQTGTAQVQQVFKIGKLGNVAGCLVTDGVVTKASKVRVIRDGVVVTENREMESLRRVKDEAKEVRAGTECGIRIIGFEDLKPEDEIVCYTVEEIARTLD